MRKLSLIFASIACLYLISPVTLALTPKQILTYAEKADIIVDAEYVYDSNARIFNLIPRNYLKGYLELDRDGLQINLSSKVNKEPFKRIILFIVRKDDSELQLYSKSSMVLGEKEYSQARSILSDAGYIFKNDLIPEGIIESITNSAEIIDRYNKNKLPSTFIGSFVVITTNKSSCIIAVDSTNGIEQSYFESFAEEHPYARIEYIDVSDKATFLQQIYEQNAIVWFDYADGTWIHQIHDANLEPVLVTQLSFDPELLTFHVTILNSTNKKINDFRNICFFYPATRFWNTDKIAMPD